MTDNPTASAHQNESGQGAMVDVLLGVLPLHYFGNAPEGGLEPATTEFDNPQSTAR